MKWLLIRYLNTGNSMQFISMLTSCKSICRNDKLFVDYVICIIITVLRIISYADNLILYFFISLNHAIN